jgi:hypothetical protein
MSSYSPYPFPGFPVAAIRRKVFISYFYGDRAWAQHFVNTFGAGVFIPKALGLDYDGADRIDSRNPDYVMEQIRERCITDSSVQIVLIGPCTHSRRYIDWEIKRSLRAGNGLLGIHLTPGQSVYLPERFKVNYDSGYAQFLTYPQSGEQLREWIETAYGMRSLRSDLVKNISEVWGYNKKCSVCEIVH